MRTAQDLRTCKSCISARLAPAHDLSIGFFEQVPCAPYSEDSSADALSIICEMMSAGRLVYFE